jgi:hypothetical protein
VAAGLLSCFAGLAALAYFIFAPSFQYQSCDIGPTGFTHCISWSHSLWDTDLPRGVVLSSVFAGVIFLLVTLTVFVRHRFNPKGAQVLLWILAGLLVAATLLANFSPITWMLLPAATLAVIAAMSNRRQPEKR